MLHLAILTLSLVLISIQAKMSQKIIGGDYATIKDFPHAVYLEAGCNEDDSSWICGSSIVNEKILVTAAHCINGCQDSQGVSDYMDAFAGVANFVEESGAVYIEVNYFKVHEDYDTNLFINDIGLVGLEERLPFGDNIKRIIIPRRFPNEKYFYIAGWGMVDAETQATEQKLKSVKQIITNYSYGCNLLEADRFCGIYAGSKKEHPAPGDSGSGLVTSNHELVGLVSFSILLENPEFVVYANVTFYHDWILHNSKKKFIFFESGAVVRACDCICGIMLYNTMLRELFHGTITCNSIPRGFSC